MSDTFAPHMETVARALCGEPNPSLSSKTELRFGQHGSLSVDLQKGTFFDHEAGQGGGVLGLVERETRLKGSEAVSYLKDKIGVAIESDRQPAPPVKAKIVATYDYADENGEVLFQVCRMEPKTFRQRRPDGDGWSWSVKGIRQVPYRLADIWNLEGHGTVYVVEGEKDADALAKLGLVATCNAGGAGKWSPELVEHFGGLDVVILPDNDEAGRKHAELVASNLYPVAQSVRVLDLPNLPPKGDASDWLKGQEAPAQALQALVETNSRRWKPALLQSRFGAVAWSDLDTVNLRQDWLVDDLFFTGDAVLTFGASGSGKSFLAVDMGLAITRGVPFLGKATRKGAVIYQAGEGGKGLVKRLKAYRQTHDLWKEDLPFILLPERVNLFAKDGEGDVEAFIAECVAWQSVLTEPLALIVIDTFSTASPGANENASEDMSRMLAAGERLQKATGAAVMWVHHKNAAGERERGHSSLRANVDTALEVIRDEETNLRTLRVLKVKDGEDGEKLGFELQSVQIGTRDDGKPITSCVVVPAQVGSDQTSQSKTRLARLQAKFLKILDDAITHRGGIIPTGERVPHNMYGVEWHQFTAMFKSVELYAGRDENAIKQALHRDGDLLFNAGMIDREGQWIWITDKGRGALK